MLLAITTGAAAQQLPTDLSTYVPMEENLASRREFSDMKFGIFIHWGIYSVFGQGEWYLQTDSLNGEEYKKAASAFYPWQFDAAEWVSAIKESGAGYLTFTSRHHDGFSMWDTEQSDFNIVDATPYGKDVVGQLAEECHRQNLRLHLYYSHVDWLREDYPWGETGHKTGRDPNKMDWAHYYAFMNRQLTELLTNYGKIGAIWFDGFWDHEHDSVPFDWQVAEQYALIHRLQPGCLVGNNHHKAINPGEDIQIFERDIPGQNTGGYCEGQEISLLPLETCQTMNWSWGYKVEDVWYKSTDQLIQYLVRTAGKGANLLLNIGPQPNGQLPAAARERLKGMGAWLKLNGESIYGTTAGDLQEMEWGVTTRKGNVLYLHLLDYKQTELTLPLTCKVKKACCWKNGRDAEPIRVKQTKTGVMLTLPELPSGVDYILKLTTK